MADLREIDARELARWQASGRPYALLDVRRDDEVRRAAIPGAVHIPMHRLQARFHEVPRGQALVVICHYGDRSEYSAQFLMSAGVEEVYNFAGGIDEYSLHLDPTIPRY